jgi:PIN domain nuclease of toxin-antitoxin system
MATRRLESGLWKASSRRVSHGALLLDTHIWVWLLEGDLDRVSHAAASLVRRAAAGTGLLVSDISFWEVAMKAAKGKLLFSMDAAFWLRRAERAPGIVTVPVSREVLLLSTRLPGHPHGDPADRMLLATAQLHRATLVTVDEALISYAARQPGIPVCDARG